MSVTKLHTNREEELQSSLSIQELQNRANAYGCSKMIAYRHNTNFDNICSAIQTEFCASLSEAQVRAYIKTILEDKNFLSEPKKYVVDWESKREEQRKRGLECYPQDLALEFFIKNKELLLGGV